MKYLIGIGAFLVALLAIVGYAMAPQASARSVGDVKFASEFVTALPTAATYGDSVSAVGSGEYEIWVSQTAVPTNFAGSIVIESCIGQSGPCYEMTPTILTTTTLSYASRATPVVVTGDVFGRYVRTKINSTGATTATLEMTTKTYNSQD